jgi:hypothetical protein
VTYTRTHTNNNRRSGEHWLAATFRHENLREVIKQHPTLAKQWVDAATDDGGDSGLLFKASRFYQRLCGVLLNESPDDGERLWRGLASNDMYSGSRGPCIDNRLALLFLSDDNPA